MLPSEDSEDIKLDSSSGRYGSILSSKIVEDGFAKASLSVDESNKDKFGSKEWMLLLSLCYVQFCLAACVSLQAPFFPKEAGLKGASATIYGFVFGVFELVIIISSPIYGKLVKWVSPSFMVISGVFLAGSCSIVFGFLNSAPYGTPFIALAFAVRIVEGLGCAAVITASFTIVAGEFPSRVAKTFGALETSFGLGLIAGPTIGGVLYEAQGFTLPFLVMGVLMLVGAVICCLVIPESKPPPEKSGNLRKYASDFGVILDGLALVTSLTFIGFNSATLEPHIRQFNISPSLIGFIFIITGSIYGITSSFWGWLCDKGIRLEILIIIGYIMQCVNLVFIGPAPYLPFDTQLWLVITSLVIGGLGLAAKVVCTFIHALRDSLERGFPNDITTHAMVSALFSSCNSLGAFIGPTVGGVMLDTIGYSNGTQILLLMEVLVLITTIFYFFFKPKRTVPEVVKAVLANQEVTAPSAPPDSNGGELASYKTETDELIAKLNKRETKDIAAAKNNETIPLLSSPK